MSKKLPKEATIEDKKYELAIEMKIVGWQNFLYRGLYLQDNPELVKKGQGLAEKFAILCELDK